MFKSGSMTIKNGSQAIRRDSLETDVETSLKGFSSSVERQNFTENHQESIANPEFKQTLFNFREVEDRRQISEIKEVIEAIKTEIKAIRQSGESLSEELSDVENIVINEKTEKSSVYTLKFLEVVLSLLRTIRMKVGESRTWLDAMMSKKAKRGSLFSSRSKKHGTQYSMSEEMKVTRSTQ